MATAQHPQGLLKILAEEIRDQEDDCSFADDFAEEIEGIRDIGFLAIGYESEYFPDDAHGMGDSFGWRNEAFNAVGEQNQADFVIAFDCRKREQGAKFGGQIIF